MQAFDRRALAILAVAGMAGSAWGQIQAITYCGRNDSRDESLKFSHLVELSSGTVSEASYLANGRAETVVWTDGAELFSVTLVPCGEVFCCQLGDGCAVAPDAPSEIINQTGHVTTTGYEYDDTMAGINGYCILGYPSPEFASFRGEVFIEAGSGINGSDFGIGAIEFQTGRGAAACNWAHFVGSCCAEEYTQHEEYGTGYVSAEHQYEVDAVGTIAATVTHTISYDASSILGSFGDFDAGLCPPREFGCPTETPYEDIVYCMKIVTRVHTLTGIVEQILDGALIVSDNATNILPLGFMDHPGFIPFSGSTSFDLVTPYNGIIGEVEINQEIVAKLASDVVDVSGDVDDDGDICGSDRVEFMDALGSAFGDANYNFRADFDLDGDVDSADLAHLNAIGCTADLDCDGSLTVFDQQAFTTAFSAMDPVADWDGDGSFTIFDFTGFGNTFALGCP